MAVEPDDVAFDDDEDWGPGPEPQPDTVRVVIHSRTADPSLLRSLARLMVGGATEGGELFFARLRTWNTQTDSLGSRTYHEAPDESRSERLRYAILGLATVGTGMAQSALTGTVAISESAYGFFSGLLSPITGSRLMRPLIRRYDGLAVRGEGVLERWVDAGRTAEQRSRALVRKAADEGSTEIIQVALGKVAQEPAVIDLVTQQGTSMAGEMIDALRNAAARADIGWERRIRTLFRRR